MKYIQTYESVNEPQIGDYILYLNPNPSQLWKERCEFFKSHIGKVIDAGGLRSNTGDIVVKVEYDDMIDDKTIFYLNVSNIVFFSKDKEKVATYLISNKYNI